MRFGPMIDQLIEALQCLPGVGPKSAQRMTLHLLERDREGGEYLSAALAPRRPGLPPGDGPSGNSR